MLEYKFLHSIFDTVFISVSDRTVTLNVGVFPIRMSEWINISLLLLKIVSNISLPSAVPFFFFCQQNILVMPKITLCANSCQTRTDYPSQFLSENKDHLVTDNRHQKKSFHSKCSCQLTAQPVPSLFFSPEYSFLATLSDCSLSTAIQHNAHLGAHPEPTEK